MQTPTTTRRKNPLTGEYTLVSPIRMTRPWSQDAEVIQEETLPNYDKKCYLCPNNTRANGETNPDYKQEFVFENDYPSLIKEKITEFSETKEELFEEIQESGICEVVCYSPQHNRNFVNFSEEEIQNVVTVWKREYIKISKKPNIQHIQIFETRGAEMGNSAPHPHCQLWSQSSIPSLPTKLYKNQEEYFKNHNSKLLLDYAKNEEKLNERVIYQTTSFMLLVPYWAEWPYETYIIPKVDLESLEKLTEVETKELAHILSITAKMYAQFFLRPKSGAPYIMAVSQKPTTQSQLQSTQLFFKFICPLLTPTRSKFQAGYEKSSEPQRDLTPEKAAQELRTTVKIIVTQ